MPRLASRKRLKTSHTTERAVAGPIERRLPIDHESTNNNALQEIGTLESIGGPTDPVAIRTRTQRCQGLFETCQRHYVAAGDDWIDKSSAAFNWWSLGIGAAKSGHSSLDRRVQSRDDVKNVIVSLLDSLKTSLENCIEIATNRDKKQKWQGDTSHLDEQKYYIKTTLQYLSKISASIRKSGTKFRHERADRLLEYGAPKLEEFRRYMLWTILVGPSKMHLLNTLLQRHTVTGDITWKKAWITLKAYFTDEQRLSAVQKRLIHANLVRRNRFDIYFRTYCQKKEGDKRKRAAETIHDTAEQAVVTPTPIMTKASDPNPGWALHHDPAPHPQPAPSRITGSVDRTVPSSQTATGIGSFTMPRRPPTQGARTVSTKFSRGALKQDYPKCPGPEGSAFWCPFCAQPLDASYSDRKKDKRWRGHVAEDLSPYVCIYEDCDTPDAMYLSTEQWRAHLAKSHSAFRWICDTCWLESDNPAEFEFDAEEAWANHLAVEHEGEFEEGDVDDLAEASRRSVIPPVSCPVCYDASTLLHPDADGHIAEHLHSFALQALPWEVVKPDDEPEDDTRGSAGSVVRSAFDSAPDDNSENGDSPDSEIQTLNLSLVEKKVESLGSLCIVTIFKSEYSECIQTMLCDLNRELHYVSLDLSTVDAGPGVIEEIMNRLGSVEKVIWRLRGDPYSEDKQFICDANLDLFGEIVGMRNTIRLARNASVEQQNMTQGAAVLFGMGTSIQVLLETSKPLATRTGLVDPPTMEMNYPETGPSNDGGEATSTSYQLPSAQTREIPGLPERGPERLVWGRWDLRAFSWVMIIVVTALDLCMAHDRIVDFTLDLLDLMRDNEVTRDSIHERLAAVIGSWRLAGEARGMARQITDTYQSAWREHTGCEAVAQLNAAEQYEAMMFLNFLFRSKSGLFTCCAASTLALAKSMQRCKISIRAGCEGECERENEWQVLVAYVQDGAGILRGPHTPHPFDRVSFPAGFPETMIQAVPVDEATKTAMGRFWKMGATAASEMALIPICQTHGTHESSDSISYRLGCHDDQAPDGVSKEILEVARMDFPRNTRRICTMLETYREEVWSPIMERRPGFTRYRKMYMEYYHGPLESYSTSEERSLVMQYQSLLLGFYYRLLCPLICLDYVSAMVTHLRSAWDKDGTRSMMGACVIFGYELRTKGLVSRDHVVCILAGLYTGRCMNYVPHSHLGQPASCGSLLGVIGTISVLALPLLRPSDQPQELAKFAIVDQPVARLVPDKHGRVFSCTGWCMACQVPAMGTKTRRVRLQLRGQARHWSIHATVPPSNIVGGGVVMAARCDKRLVGWFSPETADVEFLGDSYVLGDEEPRLEADKTNFFTVRNEDFEKGMLPSPAKAETGETAIGVVQSAESAAVRYAATGLYAEIGNTVAIANGNPRKAFNRLQARGGGIIIW